MQEKSVWGKEKRLTGNIHNETLGQSWGSLLTELNVGLVVPPHFCGAPVPAPLACPPGWEAYGAMGSGGNTVARGKQKVNFSKIQQGQALQITKVQSKKYHSERKEKKIKKRNKEKKGKSPILKVSLPLYLGPALLENIHKMLFPFTITLSAKFCALISLVPGLSYYTH